MTTRYCSKCELPKEACACADAREYDRWWKQQERRRIEDARRKEPTA